MAFSLNQIVPWGRTAEEYVAMFALTDADRRRRIIGCGDGPAGFNADWTKRGGRVVSCDPLYEFSAGQIATRFEETFANVMAETERNADEFVWSSIPSLEELGRRRREATETFLADFTSGKDEGRYTEASLPELPYADDWFDMAISSHFLFLYSEQLGLDFHRQALHEMLRVAREVRCFPLLQLGATPSPHLEPLMEELRERGHHAELQRVDYEFQRGGHTMLRIVRG